MPADRIIASESPSLQDVANANIFLADIRHSAERGGVNRTTEEDIAKVTVYRHAVLSAYVDPDALSVKFYSMWGILKHPADQNNDMPAWARALEERLNQRFTALERRFTALEVMSTKTYNRTCSRERRIPYMMVPSRDGIDPTGRENNPLPPLRTVEDLQNLTPAQLNNYMDFYHLHHVRRTTREAKLDLLRNQVA
ncbi:hypothetical protein EDD18DRAFT_1459587 [Armillaria luteobubalina]|uniref:Mug135-like C-terminal domain-containing protein n=1 Tax=Armillaria luteobubalina TaxID=153913 RepID=A0AA39QEE0_9AGAR|nr:hypothetical protein EDD18DRAFT_1459587 [Armillaria luteobubalina]